MVPKKGPDGLRRYREWAGNPGGVKEDEGMCVEEVGFDQRGAQHHQCLRKRGHGPGRQYCKQHDPVRLEALRRDRRAKNNVREREQAGVKREGRKLLRRIGAKGEVHYHSARNYKDSGLTRVLRISYEEVGRLADRLAGHRLKDQVCPQCRKPFTLTWNDYGAEGSQPQSLFISDCPSGGVYDVKVACPHCDYEEEL